MIGEFFLLSIPFTVAMTLPMSVLVAVLYAFSRLAAENEITALKASGVSPWRAGDAGARVAASCMSLFMLAFNDQVLPRANHRLRTLQDDIAQTKPTFAAQAAGDQRDLARASSTSRRAQIDQATARCTRS